MCVCVCGGGGGEGGRGDGTETDLLVSSPLPPPYLWNFQHKAELVKYMKQMVVNHKIMLIS